MQVPILSGIYTDEASDFRTSYPRNLVPVPKQQGIANGYLRPADGIVSFGTGPGADRGGINWNGACYRVMGSKLVKIAQDGTTQILGDVGSGEQVTLDYSFDRLAIASAGKLFYWNGTALTQVTDADLGTVRDFIWVDGYFMTTDGNYLIVTELNDPYSVNPLKYGSAEADPDPIVGILKLRNEVYALGRYTIEVFNNVGGDNFPFQRVEGAQIQRGVIGTFTAAVFMEVLAFLGSGRNEAPAVWVGQNGQTTKISTREIDQIIATYTETQLSTAVMEVRVDKGHQHLMIHLPDQTLVYDGAASALANEPIWFTVDSGKVHKSQYRARNLVWCYNEWLAGDPTSSNHGRLVDNISSHYDQLIGWDFGTMIMYNDGRGAIFHELELVCLSGRVALGADPSIWTSYSLDGETWSLERRIKAGQQGERLKRLVWLQQGHMRQWRVQRFRGFSDAHLAITRLEIQIEALNV